MKRTLTSRLYRLEAQVRPAYVQPAFMITFISPGDRSVTRTLIMEPGKPDLWLPGPPEPHAAPRIATDKRPTTGSFGVGLCWLGMAMK